MDSFERRDQADEKDKGKREEATGVTYLPKPKRGLGLVGDHADENMQERGIVETG